ncbi:MAG: TPM domain-containing protein [Bacteroidia bacterium]|nr:TPM domain-containing protein [Bacteroidia bacterium]
MNKLLFLTVLSVLLATGCKSDSQQSETRLGYLGKYVSDSAALFPKADALKLETILAGYDEQYNLSIAVSTVPTLGNRSLDEKSLEAASRMGLGKPGINNGALIFIAHHERNIKILTGYGLEWQVPDSISNMILDRMILPRLREDDYFAGAKDGAETLVREASQVSWNVDFEEFEPLQQSADSAVGKIVKFHARALSQPPVNTIQDLQFHPMYAIQVQTITGDSVKVYFSKYMLDMVDRIANWNDGIIFARVKNTTPWEVQLLGAE